jgi:ABC-2 type transport system permease protein
MRAYITLTRRELGAYFVSVSGYVIIALIAFLLGRSFVDLIETLRSEPTPMPLTEIFYQTFYFWIILLALTPVVTMRLFALEKFSGTFETLMTTPVTDMQVVLAKFTAAMIFYMIAWLPLLACLFILQHFGSGAAGMDAGSLGGAFIGIFLLGCLFMSLGCLASALTRSQVVAAMLALAGSIGFFALSFAPHDLPAGSESWQTRILARFAFIDQMHDFSRGVVDTRPVVLYASLTMLFLFLTLRVVESRRWK